MSDRERRSSRREERRARAADHPLDLLFAVDDGVAAWNRGLLMLDPDPMKDRPQERPAVSRAIERPGHGRIDPELGRAAVDLVAEGSSVLDVGCGTGLLGLALVKQKKVPCGRPRPVPAHAGIRPDIPS